MWLEHFNIFPRKGSSHPIPQGKTDTHSRLYPLHIPHITLYDIYIYIYTLDTIYIYIYIYTRIYIYIYHTDPFHPLFVLSGFQVSALMRGERWISKVNWMKIIQTILKCFALSRWPFLFIYRCFFQNIFDRFLWHIFYKYIWYS